MLEFLPGADGGVEVGDAVVCGAGMAERGVFFRVGVEGDVSVVEDVVSEVVNLIETLNTEKVSRAAQTLNGCKL